MGANEHSGPKMWRMSSSNDDPNEYEVLLLDVPLLTEASLPSSVSPFPLDSDEEEEVYLSSKICARSSVTLSEVGLVVGCELALLLSSD